MCDRYPKVLITHLLPLETLVRSAVAGIWLRSRKLKESSCRSLREHYGIVLSVPNRRRDTLRILDLQYMQTFRGDRVTLEGVADEICAYIVACRVFKGAKYRMFLAKSKSKLLSEYAVKLSFTEKFKDSCLFIGDDGKQQLIRTRNVLSKL